MKTTLASTVIALTLLGSASVSAELPAEQLSGSGYFLEQFGSEHENLIVLNDPLPHLQRALNSPALRRVMTEGRLVSLLGESLDPGQLWEMIDQHRRWIPDEVALGVSATAVENLGRLMRSFLLVGLCRAAGELDEAAEQWLQLQQHLLEHLRQLAVPGFKLYAHFRNEQDAAGILQLAQLQLRSMLAAVPVSIDVQPDALQLRFTAADLMADSAFAAAMLEDLGVISGPNDPRTKPLVAALSRLALELTLQRDSAGLVLTAGPSAILQPLAVEEPGPLYRREPAVLVYGRWEAARLRAAFREFDMLWEQWRDTPIGERLAEWDDEDLLSTVAVLQRRLERVSDRGTLRLDVMPAALELTLRGEDPPPAPDLAEAGLIRHIPAGAEAFTLDTTIGLGDWLAERLFDGEERFDNRVSREYLSGDPARIERAERMNEAYYGNFGTLRRLLFHQTPTVFEPGVAFLLGTQGLVQVFELRSAGSAASRATDLDLPAVEFAVIAETADPLQARQFIEELYAALVAGVLAVAEIAPPVDAVPLREIDLGLGVPSFGFESAWITWLTGISIRIEGDLVPHLFFADDSLVFSTSTRLSRQILAAGQGEAARLALPKTEAGKLVALGHYPAAVPAAGFEHLGRWIGMLGDEESAEVVATMAEFVRLVQHIHWQTIDREGLRHTRGTVQFAADGR